MGEQLLDMLLALDGVVEAILAWISVLAVAAVAAIGVTPTKVDDNALAEVKKIPVVGGLLKALLRWRREKAQ